MSDENRCHRIGWPQCRTCKFWDITKPTGTLAKRRGYCAKLAEPDWGDAPLCAWPSCGHDGPAVEFETAPDFGCTLWEAKE